jgi:hypothetical protein
MDGIHAELGGYNGQEDGREDQYGRRHIHKDPYKQQDEIDD